MEATTETHFCEACQQNVTAHEDEFTFSTWAPSGDEFVFCNDCMEDD